jgi:hypothetical protein
MVVYIPAILSIWGAVVGGAWDFKTSLGTYSYVETLFKNKMAEGHSSSGRAHAWHGFNPQHWKIKCPFPFHPSVLERFFSITVECHLLKYSVLVLKWVTQLPLGFCVTLYLSVGLLPTGSNTVFYPAYCSESLPEQEKERRCHILPILQVTKL